jgi:hypothetical protein
MRRLLLLTVVGALMMSVSPCQAEIPHLINYQGMLTDNAGNPVNEPRDLTFTIYDTPTNGIELWTETHTAVPIEDGLFNVILGGATTPIPDSVFNAPERYLGIKVGTDPELTPRIQLTSVGYAYRAVTANHAEIAGTAETDGDWTISGNHMYSAVSGNVGIGTVSPSTKLDVNGDINADSLYKIKGSTVFSVSGTKNTFLGVVAGTNNTGSKNTFVGDSAGYLNTGGSRNTFIGDNAGRYNTSGPGNTFLGTGAGLSSTEGYHNTFLGANAGDNNTTGDYNIFIGAYSGRGNTDGNDNICIGMFAGYWNTTGSYNTIIGQSAGHSLDTDSGNVFIGYRAGYSETGSNKLYIANGQDADDVLIYGDFETGNIGLGTINPSRQLHIVGTNPRILIEASSINPEVNFKNSGDSESEIWALYKHGTTDDFRFFQNGADRVTIQDGTGNVGIGATDPGQKLDVNGIVRIRSWGLTPTHDVQVNADGDLCKVSSSRRYKKNIRGLESHPDKILDLKPVSFEWKTTSEKDIGLIAEDVHELIPALVGYDREGRPDAVRYDKVAIYLLGVVKEQQERISALEKEIAELKD